MKVKINLEINLDFQKEVIFAPKTSFLSFLNPKARLTSPESAIKMLNYVNRDHF